MRMPPTSVDMAGPGHAHALAGAAEVRRHLLGPLKGRVERPRPADGVMREGQVRAPELVEQELVLDRHGDAVEGGELVRRSVVACPRRSRRCRR